MLSICLYPRTIPSVYRFAMICDPLSFPGGKYAVVNIMGFDKCYFYNVLSAVLA